MENRASQYEITEGDTLSSIALVVGVGVKDLLSANGLSLEDAKRLQIGKMLNVPSIAERAGFSYHVIEKGESLWGISKKSGVGMEELASLNEMSPDSPLMAGDGLWIPSVSPTLKKSVPSAGTTKEGLVAKEDRKQRESVPSASPKAHQSEVRAAEPKAAEVPDAGKQESPVVRTNPQKTSVPILETPQQQKMSVSAPVIRAHQADVRASEPTSSPVAAPQPKNEQEGKMESSTSVKPKNASAMMNEAAKPSASLYPKQIEADVRHVVAPQEKPRVVPENVIDLKKAGEEIGAAYKMRNSKEIAALQEKYGIAPGMSDGAALARSFGEYWGTTFIAVGATSLAARIPAVRPMMSSISQRLPDFVKKMGHFADAPSRHVSDFVGSGVQKMMRTDIFGKKMDAARDLDGIKEKAKTIADHMSVVKKDAKEAIRQARVAKNSGNAEETAKAMENLQQKREMLRETRKSSAEISAQIQKKESELRKWNDESLGKLAGLRTRVANVVSASSQDVSRAATAGGVVVLSSAAMETVLQSEKKHVVSGKKLDATPSVVKNSHGEAILVAPKFAVSSEKQKTMSEISAKISEIPPVEKADEKMKL